MNAVVHFLLDSVFVSFTWPSDAVAGWMQRMRCGEVWGSFPRSGDVDSRTVRMTCAVHGRRPTAAGPHSPANRSFAAHYYQTSCRTLTGPFSCIVSTHASLISCYIITCFVNLPTSFSNNPHTSQWIGKLIPAFQMAHRRIPAILENF